MQKNDLVTMLERQSKDWLTPQNIDEKLETELNNLLPPIIASHKDYYNRLVKFSFNIEQGKFEDAEDMKINKKIVEYKNKLLSPLYLELKTIIKYLTVTEENSAFDLYKETVNRIKSKYDSANDAQLKNLIQKISYDFKKLITLIRLENEKPENKLNLVESQLKSLVMILVVWGKYTDIIYKPEEDIEAEVEEAKKTSFHTKQRLEGKSLEELLKEKNPEQIKNYYLQRITEKKGKGKGLFLSEFLGLYDNPDLRRKMDILEADDLKRINSKNFDDPKYAKLFAQEQESEALKRAKATSSQAEKQQSGKKTTQEPADESIKKARSFDDSTSSSKTSSGNQGEASVDKEEGRESSNINKKKRAKKERAAVESSDMKMKQNKKASIGETKRKLLENEVSEVFKDEQEEEDLSGEEAEEHDATKAQKATRTQEEIERNRKQLEEFEAAVGSEDHVASASFKAENAVNEKLKEFYEKVKSERIAPEPNKDRKAENAIAGEKKAAVTAEQEKQVNIDNKEQAAQSKKTRHIAAEYLERSVKHKIDSNNLIIFIYDYSFVCNL